MLNVTMGTKLSMEYFHVCKTQSIERAKPNYILVKSHTNENGLVNNLNPENEVLNFKGYIPHYKVLDPN